MRVNILSLPIFMSQICEQAYTVAQCVYKSTELKPLKVRERERAREYVLRTESAMSFPFHIHLFRSLNANMTFMAYVNKNSFKKFRSLRAHTYALFVTGSAKMV